MFDLMHDLYANITSVGVALWQEQSYFADAGNKWVITKIQTLTCGTDLNTDIIKDLGTVQDPVNSHSFNWSLPFSLSLFPGHIPLSLQSKFMSAVNASDPPPPMQ